jgi:hypothetical protein
MVSDLLPVFIVLEMYLVYSIQILIVLIVITATLRTERSMEEAATRHSHEVPMPINVDSGRNWGTLGS